MYLQRLSPQKQVRLTKLMDKNTEGRLSQAEQLEKHIDPETNEPLLQADPC